MSVPLQRTTIGFWVAALLLAVCAYACMPWWTVDDAFISYRYGRNLFAFGELNWNVGEQPVEGYTGILLPLLSGLLWKLGLPMIDAIKVLGIGALVGTVVLTEGMLRRLRIEPMRRGIVTLLLAAAPILYMHSLSGLETVFFMAALSGVFYALAGMQDRMQEGRFAWPLAMALLLTALCRPEGLALALIVLIHVLLLRKRFNTLTFKRYLIVLTCFVIVPLAALWAWRRIYYGQWLPNSYYAKLYYGLLNPESLWAMAKFVGYYLGLPLLASLIVGGRPRWSRLKAEWLLWGAWLAFVLVSSATYLHSNLWMNYGSRFFVPMLPMGLVFCAYLSQGDQKNDSHLGKRRYILAAMLVAQLGIMGFRLIQEKAFLTYYHAIVQDELIPAGQYVRSHLPLGRPVISFMDAGALGYYGEVPIIDFGRLNDRYLAQNQLTPAQVANYFFMSSAEGAVITSESPTEIQYIDEVMQIVADPRFAEFKRVLVLGNHVDYPYWQHVFVRR